MKDWPPQLWAAIITTVGAAAGWLGKMSNNRADAAVKLSDGALRIVQELQEEVSRLRKDRDYDRERMRHLEVAQNEEREWCDRRIGQLVSTLHGLGIDVPPPPPRHDEVGG